MLIKIYRLLLIAILIGLIFVVRVPRAYALPENEPDGLTGVQLLVYPEYDDPRLLVMFRGQITGVTPSTDNPATVRFLVPSVADMYSAGFFNTQGQYIRGGFVDPAKTTNDPYPERKASGIAGLDEITFTIETAYFVVEYYAPIIIGNPNKTIAYQLHLLYPIDDLEVSILEPRASANFYVTPEGAVGTDDVYGEPYRLHTYIFNDLVVSEDSPLQFNISYTKSDTRPSVSITSNGSTLLVVGIVCGVSAAIIGVLFVIRRARQKALIARRPVRVSKKKAKRQGFCRQCGNQMDRPSPYCPYCGAKQ